MDIRVNGQVINFLIDTASSINVIRNATYERRLTDESQSIAFHFEDPRVTQSQVSRDTQNQAEIPCCYYLCNRR